jgi:hypothetical protein
MCHPLQILLGGVLASRLAAQTLDDRNPKAAAYHAVQEATDDVEVAAYQESGEEDEKEETEEKEEGRRRCSCRCDDVDDGSAAV